MGRQYGCQRVFQLYEREAGEVRAREILSSTSRPGQRDGVMIAGVMCWVATVDNCTGFAKARTCERDNHCH